MKFSFQFDAPKYHSFFIKQPEKSTATYLDPKSPESQWFLTFKNKHCSQKSNLGGNQSLNSNDSKENKENLKVENFSKKDVKITQPVKEEKNLQIIKDQQQTNNRTGSQQTTKTNGSTESLQIVHKIDAKSELDQLKHKPIEKPSILQVSTKEQIKKSDPAILPQLEPKNLYNTVPVQEKIEIKNLSKQETQKNLPNQVLKDLNTEKKPGPYLVGQSSFPAERRDQFLGGFGLTSFQAHSFQSFSDPMPDGKVFNSNPSPSFVGPINSKVSSNVFPQLQNPIKSDLFSSKNQPDSIPNHGNNLFSSAIYPPAANQTTLKTTYASNNNSLNNNIFINRASSLPAINQPSSHAGLNRTNSLSSPKLPSNNHVTYRAPPCLFPLRVQRQWQETFGRKWYQLSKSQVPKAQEQMKQIMNRQNGTGNGGRNSVNLNGNRNIFTGQARSTSPILPINRGFPQQNNQKKVANPLFNKDNGRPFKF